MAGIKTLADLKRKQEEVKTQIDLRDKAENPGQPSGGHGIDRDLHRLQAVTVYLLLRCKDRKMYL